MYNRTPLLLETILSDKDALRRLVTSSFVTEQKLRTTSLSLEFSANPEISVTGSSKQCTTKSSLGKIVAV